MVLTENCNRTDHLFGAKWEKTMEMRLQLVNQRLAELARLNGVALTLDLTQFFAGKRPHPYGHQYQFVPTVANVCERAVYNRPENLDALVAANELGTGPIYGHGINSDECAWVKMFPDSPRVRFMFQVRVYHTRGTPPNNLEGLPPAVEKIVNEAWRVQHNEVLAKVGKMFEA